MDINGSAFPPKAGSEFHDQKKLEKCNKVKGITFL